MNKLLLVAAILAAFTLGCLCGQQRCRTAEADFEAEHTRAQRLQRNMWHWMVEYSRSETARHQDD